MSNKFKKGDEVIALSSKDCKYNPREEGKKYKVHAVFNCRECNDEIICINNVDLPIAVTIKCSECGCTDFSSNKPWTRASQFRLSSNNLHIELQLAIEREDYEYAAKLRDQLNDSVDR